MPSSSKNIRLYLERSPETDGAAFADLAVKAVERLKGNIARYVSIL